MAEVHADPDELEAFASAFYSQITQISELAQSVAESLNAVESWHDGKRNEFEAQIEPMLRQIENISNYSETDLIPWLNNRILSLREYGA